MVKPDVKKIIITNLPYLLFVWLFGKVGEAWRLAAGADASQKLLHFMDSLAAAFANALPSFHPFDLCIGIAGAVLVRLAVYLKGKNAKKYRHGMEYGSARWGGAKDIAPYIDPVFENNILLTQTERLTMNGRPKDPKTARNKNVLVIGGSGSGKTRFFVKPNLMQMHSSYCITDPKYLFAPQTVEILNDQGGASLTVERSGLSPTLRSQTHGNLPVVAAGFDLQQITSKTNRSSRTTARPPLNICATSITMWTPLSMSSFPLSTAEQTRRSTPAASRSPRRGTTSTTSGPSIPASYSGS